MIIVDYSRLAIAGIMSQLKGSTKIETDLARHFLLNMIRSIHAKYHGEYGELVLAIDSSTYWRRDVFPQYKAHRKKNRDESGFDWHGLFVAKDTIKAELKEFFPYKVIEYDGAEADDVIGALCKRFGNTSEKIMIVASDSDFFQLLHYMNVSQYCPVKKKILQANPAQSLLHKILKGDKKDGIPNIRSADDTYVTEKRSLPVSEKFIASFDVSKLSSQPEEIVRNYHRNVMLIDLDKIPETIYNGINKAYDEYVLNDRSALLDYFVKHKLRNLVDKIGDF